MTNLHAMPQPLQMHSKQEEQARQWASAQLSAHRFTHTIGVVKTITSLAEHYGLEEHVPTLRIAAWIHDAAKEIPTDKLLAYAETMNYPIREVERACPELLHGVIAVDLARKELGIADPVIASAVLYHTTGHPEMSKLDKLFYLADLIEPTRSFSWIMQARQLAYQDADVALLFALTYQLRRMLRRGTIIDPRGLELRNKLLFQGVRLVARSRS